MSSSNDHVMLVGLQSPERGGGAEKQLALLAQVLRPYFKVSLVVCRAPSTKWQTNWQAQGIATYVLQQGHSFWQRRRRGPRLLDLCRQLRPALIYARFIDLNLILAQARRHGRLEAKLVLQETNTRSKILYDNHGALMRWYYWHAIRRTYPHADVLLCNGRGERQDLIQHFGLAPSLCRYLPNMLAAEDYIPWSHFEQRWQRKITAPLRIVCIGSLIRAKDYPTVIAAAARARQYANFLIDIYGEGPLRHTLQQMINRYQLNAQVRLRGFLKRAVGWGEHYEMLLSCSLYEGMSNVLLEAMAAGLAVVVSDVSGSRDVLQHSSQGIVVPPADPDTLAEVIVRLAREPAQLVHYARQARQRAQDFHVKVLGLEYVRLLRQVLSSPRESL